MIVGVLIAGFPFAKNYYQQYHNQKLVEQLLEQQSQTKDIKENADIYNEAGSISQQVNSNSPVYDSVMYTKYRGYVGADDIVNSNSPQNNRLMLYFDAPEMQEADDGLTYLGTIEIPSIDLNMPLVEGTDDDDIAISAGHMEATAYPGQIGNCVIVGHRGYSFGRLFNRLDELTVGDKIIVNVGSDTYTYTVYLTKVVLPTDTSVTNQTNKAKVLTLSTCTPLYSSDYRLIIHSKMN